MQRDIPILVVKGETLAEAYEKALIELNENGRRMSTQYDKPGDPQSIDATMNITINDPLADPMIHKAFPGGIEDLREYVMELQGIKDRWVKNMNDPDDTRWEYTYHGRLANYGVWQELQDGKSVETGPFKVDQIEKVISKLCEQPYTRQAQMITWMPNLDNDCYDPPCLQSIWYRITEDEEGQQWLNCNVRFRSNDAWGANFMNMFGFIFFNKEVIADEVTRRTGKEVKIGRLNWHADSYHIYGKDVEHARSLLFNRMDKTTFEQRTFNFSDDFIQEMYVGSESMILGKIDDQNKNLGLT